jgi:Fe-S cluster assembly ATP-binding protein
LSELIKIVDLHASIQGKEILKGVNLTINAGEVHAIMGKNGSGKSTLSNIIMGHPNYEITKGDILFQGESILELKTDERAKKGIFLCFQYPTGIPGVTVANFLRTVLKSLTGKEIAIKDFRKDLKEAMKLLQMDDSFVSRYVNEVVKRNEMKSCKCLYLNRYSPYWMKLTQDLI